ncbi:nitroreductase family deazaflavin-dependent oxidoreductase [Nocardia suismassiliense]|uniref:nitroreductase family deazaflavin-dependent oxidoreductase n=1 Tax=Nocardia suismassiliense TaxID=2077092 RepID=UPI000D1E8458|nr:nitroreductase family deazaflavin-dependent oxidoreductase [Nocardia suismassiliense]
MPAPRWIARVNRIGLNRITRFIAPWAPGWAVVIHRGRKSGRTFRTPLWAFRRDDRYVIALTYGPESDWVRNVLAASGCQLESRRRRYEVDNPRVYRDETAAEMPSFIRFMLCQVLAAPDFLSVEIRRELKR